MRFNTHDRTPMPKVSKGLRILFAVFALLIFGILVALACLCADYAHSPAPAILILGLPLILSALVLLHIRDMAQAYVEIDGDRICVVDCYFGVKKRKIFSAQDIAEATILPGSSFSVRGYRWSVPYIVFRGSNGKYLFKVICLPETKQFFVRYINICSESVCGEG